MATVNKILEAKGHQVFSIQPETIVFRALEIMVEKNVSALLVTEGDKLVGIFTERDYARKVVLKGKASRDINISEVMTQELVTVSTGTSIEECMQLMTSRFIRHLPVLDGDQLRGIISIGDVVKYIIEDQRFIIESMEHFITGR